MSFNIFHLRLSSVFFAPIIAEIHGRGKKTRPQGGLFLWVTVPEEIDTAELLKEAVEEKVAFVPGFAFYADGRGHNTMRLNFSNAQPEMIQEGIRRLGKVIEKRLEKAKAVA